ncbi:hypothetical protein HQ584_07315 [Patescibacteria group bacterium]|nr:hypothetical protein [Patescibacteria group bacterium]
MAERIFILQQYLSDTGRDKDQAPSGLIKTKEEFDEIRDELEWVRYEDVSSSLGGDTPDVEKHGYFPVGRAIAFNVVDLVELGTLIARDPESPERFGSEDLVRVAAAGFLEEGRGIAAQVCLIKDCPRVRGPVEQAFGILEKSIESFNTEE